MLFSDHGANGGGWDITSRLESLRTTQQMLHTLRLTLSVGMAVSCVSTTQRNDRPLGVTYAPWAFLGCCSLRRSFVLLKPPTSQSMLTGVCASALLPSPRADRCFPAVTPGVRELLQHGRCLDLRYGARPRVSSRVPIIIIIIIIIYCSTTRSGCFVRLKSQPSRFGQRNHG